MLLAATSALVLVLLLLIYRSPVVAFVPLFVVALAYVIAAGIVYLLIFQLGFAVALGVLVDTFVVRTLLVPALALLLGRWTWWPGRVSPDDA